MARAEREPAFVALRAVAFLEFLAAAAPARIVAADVLALGLDDLSGAARSDRPAARHGHRRGRGRRRARRSDRLGTRERLMLVLQVPLGTVAGGDGKRLFGNGRL